MTRTCACLIVELTIFRLLVAVGVTGNNKSRCVTTHRRTWHPHPSPTFPFTCPRGRAGCATQSLKITPRADGVPLNASYLSPGLGHIEIPRLAKTTAKAPVAGSGNILLQGRVIKLILECLGICAGDAVGSANAKKIIHAAAVGIVLVDGPNHGAAKTQFISCLDLKLHRLPIVIADPLVGVPGDPLDSCCLVERLLSSACGDDAEYFCIR